MGLHEFCPFVSIGPVVSEEKTFKNVDIHTHIRTTEAYVYYKLTNEPKGSGELKRWNARKQFSEQHVWLYHFYKTQK